MSKKTHPLVEAASAYTGYTARDVNNTFAIDSGYTGGFQWDGSFVDRVLKNVGAASALPHHVNTAIALGFYIRNGWVRRAPKPGDLVFYTFPTESHTVSFDPGHIGVVTETDRWKTDHVFKSVEAQVASGLPKAASDSNGVYERTRYATDVAAFVRIPKRYLETIERPALDTSAIPTVRPAHFARCVPGKFQTAKPEFRKSVETVQIALAAHPGVRLQNADRGVFNGKTRAALAAFQRLNGFSPEDCNGDPNAKTLELLANGAYSVVE